MKKKELLKVKKLAKDAELPEYALDTDVGLDLRAIEDVSIEPMEHKAVRTGIAIEIPKGCVGLIRDRAGVITQMGVHTVAGTFDPAFRGEVSVVLTNFGEEEAFIERGMRIAQLIILPIIKPTVVEVKELSDTERGKRGFGSTGLKEIIKEIDKIESMINEKNS